MNPPYPDPNKGLGVLSWFAALTKKCIPIKGFRDMAFLLWNLIPGVIPY